VKAIGVTGGPRRLTYKASCRKRLAVRKGAKGTHIEFWEVKPEERNGEQKRERRRRIHPSTISAASSIGFTRSWFLFQTDRDRGRYRDCLRSLDQERRDKILSTSSFALAWLALHS
jgi:hypothetical protein